MEAEPSPEVLQAFLTNVMQIQRRYAFELRNVKADRRGEIIEAVNKAAAEVLSNDEARPD